jgi:3-phenylpropionate/trans-cinnamate dioxygenase ferredoxin reductase component
MDGGVLVVGAGLAGTRCAEALRAGGYDDPITLVGEEPRPPYERPGLSKDLLTGTKTPEALALRPAHHWQDLSVDVRLGTRITGIDARSRTAVTDGGRILTWRSLVLATGARARTLDDLPAGVHVLRTLTDALALRRELRPGRRLVVVGAGFIGGEVATSASALGADVAVVEAAPVPLERVLGREVGRLIAGRYREQGIELRLGAGLAGFRRGPAGRVRGVLLADGRELACDAVVLGIGAEPVAPVGTPAGRGGIPTDACGRTALPGVYACGDAASTYRPSLGRRIRVEHWTSASAQGAAVAAAILGREEPHDDPPYFWSDQLDLRLQHVGHADGWARVEVDADSESFRARYLADDGRLVAALVANRPAEVASLRRELAA